MTQSDIFANVKNGESGEAILQFDVSNLAEGRYFFEPDVYEQNEFGAWCSYDHPLQRVFFKIEKEADSKVLNWNKQYFGNVVLNEMKVVQS